MTPNLATVEAYLEAFRRKDHPRILACLTDDVVWEIPGFSLHTGKAAFAREIDNEGFVGLPEITAHRHTEENDVVITEGTVRAQKRDGAWIVLRFCDVFEMRDGRIARLTSYLVMIP